MNERSGRNGEERRRIVGRRSGNVGGDEKPSGRFASESGGAGNRKK
jgi:hypothetical protein